MTALFLLVLLHFSEPWAAKELDEEATSFPKEHGMGNWRLQL
jgi:hypothetical protein